MTPNLKEAIKATEAHCTILNENLAVIEDFDLTPFDEKDKAEMREHLNYLAGICQSYLKFAEPGFNPDEDE